MRAILGAGPFLGFDRFVRRVTINGVTDGTAIGETGVIRDVKRWSTVLIVVVEMSFDKTDVLANRFNV